VQAANRLSIDSTRQLLSEHLTGLPSANQFVGIISALSLGIRHEVDDAAWQLLRDTGTAHLLAISGLHVSLIALWGFVVGRQITRFCMALGWVNPVQSGTLEPRTAGLALSFILACTYTIISGFELPTQRALVMLLVWLIAAWHFRYLPPGAALCIALGVVLLVNPLNSLTVGFWLSFGTVGTLFYLHSGHQVRSQVAPAANSLITKTRKISHMLKTHVLIGVCLLPVGAWFFQSGSLVAPLANLLAVPWTAIFIVPFSLISACLSSLVPAMANLSLYVAQWSVEVLLGYLSVLDQHVPAAVTLSVPSTYVLVLTISGLLSLFAPRGLGLRWLAGPLLAPFIVFNLQRAPVEGFELHVLDVGQGLAALVFTDERTMLFDTGGKVSRSLSMFEAVVIPYLHAKGRRRIDTLIVSHSDEDHSFGAQDLVARFPDVQVFASNPLDLPDTVNQQPCIAGDSWASGSVNFAFLHPAAHDRGSKNDLSCVLLVYTGSSRVLLTGDIEAQGEYKLASRVRPGGQFDLDVLVAPHHGSATSSSQYLLDVFKPEYVVFPSGQRNRYGFPHADVQLRYNLLGARSFTTGTDGAVSFLLGESGLYRPPLSWWKSHRRFWHGIINPDCWPLSASKSNVLRMLELAQKGQTLCGK
jgi:competence protein ComEC